MRQLFIGIDVAKTSHVAGFLSSPLLQRFKHFEFCPTLAFKNTRAGFEDFINKAQTFADLKNCFVLLESTGHYHQTLMQYLQEKDIPVYMIHAQKRMAKQKTDKRDALILANMLFNQIGLRTQVADNIERVRLIARPTKSAALLGRLIQHHIELIQDRTKRKNKLTAICDELFPELTIVCRDPNSPTALALREHFPTPNDIASADLDDLIAVGGKRGRPGRPGMQRLQELAKQSIGTKEPGRVQGLRFEQRQLIAEIRLINQHIAAIEAEIEQTISGSREGQILMSLPVIGSVQAAAIIAAIGNIENFETPGKLKAYFGWSPKHTQTGSTIDSMTLNRHCNKSMQNMFYMLVFTAITKDCEWRLLYERLVPIKCQYDSRTEKYRGKNKVIGRVAGQMISMIWHFLQRDRKLLASVAEGQELPPPQLYDRSIHAARRQALKA